MISSPYVPVALAIVIEQILWWAAIATEALVLLRSCDAGLYRKYPAFYLYLATILSFDLLRLTVLIVHPGIYGSVFWSTELFSGIVGYAVVIEIYKHTLKRFPGVARVARSALFALLGAILLTVMVSPATSRAWSPAATIAELARNLHAAQALLLMAVISLLVYYVVPIGRNLKGILFGYGFYVAASVMSSAFGSLPRYAHRPEWQVLHQIACLIALCVWCRSLWSYQPSTPEAESGIEWDYRFIADQTRKALLRAHLFLKQSVES